MPDDRSEPREWEVGASAGACFFFPLPPPTEAMASRHLWRRVPRRVRFKNISLPGTFPPFQDLEGFKMFHNKHSLLLKNDLVSKGLGTI